MSWDLDAYGALLDAASGYRFVVFDHEPQEGELFLRHDVDLSLAAAAQMAELEAARGVSATYFLMTRSVSTTSLPRRANASLRGCASSDITSGCMPFIRTSTSTTASIRCSRGTTRSPSSSTIPSTVSST
jgi:hypothetical protein